MRAILLSAGFGTRLRPLTEKVPKCLISIKGTPLLQLWVEKLYKIGVTEFLVNTHYLHEQVDTFIKKKLGRFKIKVVYEEKLQGTAGILFDNLDFIGSSDAFLLHVDNYCEDDLQNMLITHKNKPQECLMTMLIFQTKKPKQSGIVTLDRIGKLIGFDEKPENPKSNLANGAIYFFSNDFTQYLRKMPSAVDFSNEIIPDLVGRTITYKAKGNFVDIGTVEAYEYANGL